MVEGVEFVHGTVNAVVFVNQLIEDGRFARHLSLGRGKAPLGPQRRLRGRQSAEMVALAG